ncbi:MAG TPA: mannose-6-phosphate isomerase, class I [Polyangiaceae bacterium]|jgi:mannose-6-phosphate isomerase
MFSLENSIQPYAWGSHRAIAELQGRGAPTPEPEAELWLGAHPSASSRALPSKQSLLTLIEERPNELLSAAVAQRFGPRLPFLLKVLAAETPLSLQAHPSLAQARAGFAAEQAAGVPLGAAQRNYKDDNHKPELLCALTPFHALCGFRSARETLELFGALESPLLEQALRPLAAEPNPSGLRAVFSQLMTAEPARRSALSRETVERARAALGRSSRYEAEFGWTLRIAALYPGDIGVTSALLLNLVELTPGQAIYLPAGNLHAYLGGTGIEIMANSDNVLRGGLTPKHVDVPELLKVLDFADGPVPVLTGVARGAARTYDTPAPEFELSRIELSSEAYALDEHVGPEILLCTSGSCAVESGPHSLPLPRGQSAFVSAADSSPTLRGPGTAFRARVGRFAH